MRNKKKKKKKKKKLKMCQLLSFFAIYVYLCFG